MELAMSLKERGDEEVKIHADQLIDSLSNGVSRSLSQLAALTVVEQTINEICLNLSLNSN